MKQIINPLWEKILKEVISVKTKKAETIARIISAEIDNGGLAAGADILTQREISEYCKSYISRGTIESAFKILSDQNYITTKTSGTKVTDRTERVERNTSHPREFIFDQVTPFPKEESIKALNKLYLKLNGQHANLAAWKRKRTCYPKLNLELRKLINISLPAAYQDNEIFYTSNRSQAIDSICKVLLPENSSFLIASPAESTIKDAASVHTIHTVLLNSDFMGISIVELEKACVTGRVGILYLRSRSSHPVNRKMLKDRIVKILDLQKKHGFLIIEDDIYAEFFKNTAHLLMELAAEMGGNIIYLRSLTMNHPELHKAIIIAGNKEVIALVRENMMKTGKVLDAVLSEVLVDLLPKASFVKNQKQISDHVHKLNKRVREILITANLWKIDGISTSNGWFFYLEPSKGCLPDNTYQLLLNRGIKVFNPAEFEWLDSQVCGIKVSFATYAVEERLERDMEFFHETIREIIR